ncbi:MAG: hypothetical protein KDJ65_39325, partial [Anaerolineae bacterium]|nr:hypothetical protein [Anaerolineae bacterium]
KNDPNINRGAVFVRAIREFTDIAGIDLGLKRVSSDTEDVSAPAGNPGSQSLLSFPSPLATPSMDEAIWSETQSMLRRQMTQATYDTIIQGTRLVGQSRDKYIVGVHSDMAKEWLENRLRDIVQRALSGVVGQPTNIEFVLLDGGS